MFQLLRCGIYLESIKVGELAKLKLCIKELRNETE